MIKRVVTFSHDQDGKTLGTFFIVELIQVQVKNEHDVRISKRDSSQLHIPQPVDKVILFNCKWKQVWLEKKAFNLC